jgi:hypothetical protein
MFFPSYTVQLRDPLEENTNIVIQRDSAASRIDFRLAVSLFDPCDEVLDHPLVQLVQYVGCNRSKDVCVGQLFPEWVNNWFYSDRHACLRICCTTLIQGIECGEDVLQMAGRGVRITVTKIFMLRLAFWAITGFAAADEKLLRVIANVAGNNGMATANLSISTAHTDTGNTGITEQSP